MASLAFTDGYVELDSNDLSAYGTNLDSNIEADALEDTAFGDTYRSRIAGLKDTNGTITFNQDFADNLLDEIMFGIVGTVVAAEFRPTSSAASASNPAYQMNVVITGYTPFQQGVGELGQASCTWVGAGAVTRAVA